MDQAWREFRRTLNRDARTVLRALGTRPTRALRRKLVDQEIARLKRAYIEHERLNHESST